MEQLRVNNAPRGVVILQILKELHLYHTCIQFDHTIKIANVTKCLEFIILFHIFVDITQTLNVHKLFTK